MHRFLGPGVLLLLHIVFFWRIVLTGQYTWLESPDMAHMVLPRFQFMASEWRHMRLPMWDPHQWLGQPFLAQFTGAAMPLNWPFFVLAPFDHGKVRIDLMHWHLLMVHWLGAVFCYWLCRDLGRSRSASILAGCLFSFGGFFATADWPEVTTGVLWTPLVFLFVLRAARRAAEIPNAAFAGAACGMAWLSGHHQAPFYMTLAALAVLLADRRIRGAAGLLAFAGCVGALQLLPGHEYGKLSRRWAGAPNPLNWNEPVPFSVHTQYSIGPSDLMGLLVPNVGSHVTLLLGVAGLLLVILAIRGYWDRAEVKTLTVLAAAGLLFSMAEFNVFQGVLYALVPMFEKARVPARTAMLTGFAVAPLAAFGLDWLRENAPRRLPGMLAGAGAGLYLFLIALMAVDKPVFVGRLSGPALCLLLLAAALTLRGRALAAGVTAVMLIELQQARSFSVRTTAADSQLELLRGLDDIAAWLRAQPGPVRVEVNGLSHNLGEWHLIDTSEGFGAGVTSNVLDSDWPSERMRDLFGVGYTISKEPTRAGQVDVFQGTSGFKIFRNPGAFQRGFVAHEARVVKDTGERQAWMANPGVDLRRTVFVDTPAPALETCDGPEPVRWIERRAARIRLEVEARCKGILVVQDTWYPGWKATVDGQETEILPVDTALRGVVTGPGRHVVEMRFRPWTVFAGAALSALGLLGALALGWRARRRDGR